MKLRETKNQIRGVTDVIEKKRVREKYIKI